MQCKTCEAQTEAISEWKVLFIVCVAQFLGPLMGSSVGIALPSIGYHFSASAAMLSRVESDYILAFSIILLPAGRFGDIYGRKKVFTAGLILFTLATAVLPFAWNIGAFVLIRLFQGCGAAMITSTSVAILMMVFPPSVRGRAMGIITASVYTGISVGPVVGGAVVTHLGWQWVFYMVLPLCLIAVLLTFSQLRGEWFGDKGGTFDWLGTVFFMGSISALVYGVMEAEGIWGTALVVAGLAGLCFFLWLQSHSKSPLLDVSLLLRNKVFAFSNLATLINYASSFGVVFLLSLYLQYVRGCTPQEAGLLLVVQPIVQAVLSPLAGRMSDKISPALLATSGMALCTVGLAWTAFLTVETPLYIIGAILVVFGFGFGIFASPNMNTIMSSVAARHYGVASGLVATMRTQGMLVCMTTITFVFTIYLGDATVSQENIPGFMSSLETLFILFSGLSVLGVFMSMVRTSGKREPLSPTAK
ncbi:MAG: MFS transporter [Desulfovibrio sp.]|uniref:MFS transporter n=1 Tax=Desulfovibrio sp. 7SRBS1 TaxID=3378064 RepID=UPI003B414D87